MAKRKTNWQGILTIVLIVGAVIVGGAFLGAGEFLQTAFSSDEDGSSGDFAYSYVGKNVEISLQSTNSYTASSIDPTFYIYNEEPENWGDGRVSVEDGYVSTASSSSGTATMTETPDTYYVRAVVSGYYDEFFTVTIPAGGDVPLSQYNDGGEDIVKVQMIDVEALSVSNVDLGISTNETSDKTYYAYANFNVDDDEGYRLDEIKFREDATYSFATDSDGDGIYDEGINKIVVMINGKSHTLFHVAGSIDEFSGDDEAVVDISSGDKDFVEYAENGVVSMTFEVTCDATLDTTGDADEKCGDGEDFLDSIILVDSAGNTASFDMLG